MKILVLSALLCFSASSALASSGDPMAKSRVVNMGNSVVTVAFDNTMREFQLSQEQLEALVARVSHLEGLQYFVIPSGDQGRMFPAGTSVSARKSISVNLPPHASLIAVRVSHEGGTPQLFISCIRNNSDVWATYTGLRSTDMAFQHGELRTLAQGKR